MKKTATQWPIKKLLKHFDQIEFPEYQREATIWRKPAKQRLIDSIAREFDISAIYLYKHQENQWDCVDGRQRLAAIHSFVGENKDDKSDNEFEFKVLNEIYEDQKHPYEDLHEMSFAHIKEESGKGNDIAGKFVRKFDAYEVTVVELTESEDEEEGEFNLQFTRLNLGQLIISGEKLNAMLGDLRNVCFDDFGEHDFFNKTRIPRRRFACQQLIAQIVAQVFAYEMSDRDRAREFPRIRHLDLQLLFKEHAELGQEQVSWLKKLNAVMDTLARYESLLSMFRSRAIVLSLVTLAYERDIDEDENAAEEFADFAIAFTERLRDQVKQLPVFDANYRYLIDFQRHLTQGSGEKLSISERSRILNEQFELWQQNKKLQGD